MVPTWSFPEVHLQSCVLEVESHIHRLKVLHLQYDRHSQKIVSGIVSKYIEHNYLYFCETLVYL